MKPNLRDEEMYFFYFWYLENKHRRFVKDNILKVDPSKNEDIRGDEDESEQECDKKDFS